MGKKIKKGEEKMLGFGKKKKEVKVKDEEKFASEIPVKIDTKDLKVKITVDPAIKKSFEHFHTHLVQHRSDVATFLSVMRDEYKLIRWQFEPLGGGQYFVVAEVDEKLRNYGSFR